ncbi:hypothetical protein; putative membrane protein [Frankia alni ACN14a]|uniref:Uncharacterized protein n=1 Tax=Frankia alni (strain DSM 45986 / CECT 9034 / ACN14a) TaxID=326424 RepID=Q0RN66_FRAAA|nr:hypothetical protein; putative membrane protein [Frankia alni ACN14a]
MPSIVGPLILPLGAIAFAIVTYFRDRRQRQILGRVLHNRRALTAGLVTAITLPAVDLAIDRELSNLVFGIPIGIMVGSVVAIVLDRNHPERR